MSYFLSCVTINVRGLNATRKRKSIFRWLHNNHFQVCFLQETYSSFENERIWNAEWGNSSSVFSHGTKHSRGVAVLFSNNCSIQVQNSFIDKNGRYIILDAIINNCPVVLANIYSPNDQEQQCIFFHKVSEIVDKLAPNKNVIIGGDFNCCLSELDKNGGQTIRKKMSVINTIDSLTNKHSLIDIWRKKHGTSKQYSWRNMSRKVACRLDYWLISSMLVPDTVETEIIYVPFSDHSAVSVKIRSKEFQKRGPGFWKFNNSLLSDEVYLSEIKTKLVHWIKYYEDVSDPRLFWDLLKMEIRAFTINYCKAAASRKKSVNLNYFAV